MPECRELQTPLAIAIADLEVTKKTMLRVFEWSKYPGMIKDEIRQLHLMDLAICKTNLPIIEMEIQNAINLLIKKEGA